MEANQPFQHDNLIIAIALDGMNSSAVLNLFRLFFCEVAVGVGGSDERHQSAPTQTAPQQVDFGSDRDCGVDKVSRSPDDNGLR